MTRTVWTKFRSYTPYKIWLQSVQWFLKRRCVKSVDVTDDGWTDEAFLPYKPSAQVSQNRKYIKPSGFCHKEGILIPYCPLSRECDPTYPHSGLIQGTYLTNKHNHFKEIRD